MADDRITSAGQRLAYTRPTGVAGLLGRSPVADGLREIAARAAKLEANVICFGETGVGKGVLARAIHEEGDRREEPFVSCNVASIPEALIESAIFGHARGAFTGAHEDKPGVFDEARGGTVFLDEIGELSLAAQAKLLHVIEERRSRPVGGRSDQPIRARIIAATLKDLDREVAEERFRRDLLFRLDEVRIVVPPLRDRLDDLLIHLRQFAAEAGHAELEFSPQCIALLREMDWSGNLRQLRNLIPKILMLTTETTVTAAHVEALLERALLRRAARTTPRCLDARAPIRTRTEIVNAFFDLPDGERRVGGLERAIHLAALERAGGNKTRAGRLVGVHRNAIDRTVRRRG